MNPTVPVGYIELELIEGSKDVFTAYDLRRHKQVAVKILDLPKTRKGYGAAIEKFHETAQRVRMMRHAGLVPLWGSELHGSCAWLIMPRLKWGNLHDVLRTKGPLPLSNALSILDQLAGAVDHLHQHGFIHCSVYPRNVLFNEDGKVMLTDAALVSHLWSSSRPAVVPEEVTPYLPPECRTPGGVLLPQADLYSLGVLVCDMVTGELPFAGKARPALPSGANEPPVPLSHFERVMGSAASEVVLKTLAADPQDRPASAEAFAKELRLALNQPRVHIRASSAEIPSVAIVAPETLPTDSSGSGERPQRFVNTCWTKGDEGAVISRTTNLQGGSDYRFRVDIGPLSTESIVENAREEPIPDHLLPEIEGGYWLQALVTSDDFAVQDKSHRFFLPRTGSAWVCGCQPDAPHQCEKGARASYLYIPARSPRRSGAARLRLGIYFQGNLVQSQLVTAEIDESEKQGTGSGAWIDYTLSARLDALEFLRPREFNILTNANADGSHRIVVNGSANKAMSFRLTEGKATEAMQGARASLYDIHIEENEAGQRRNRFNELNAKSKVEFLADLGKLAMDGWILLSALVNDKDRLKSLIEWVSERSTIQISRAGGTEFVFPWALIYDIPMTQQAVHRPCRVVDQWDGESPLVDDRQSQCPYKAEHRMNTLCPFGFWGYRHVIEQPPSMPQGRTLVTDIEVAVPRPDIVVGRSLELDVTLSEAHLQHIKSGPPRIKLRDCDTLNKILDALKDAGLELLYLYCHGRRRTSTKSTLPQPTLRVGDKEEIIPSDLVAWQLGDWPEEHWMKTSPLVFINGCHTVEFTPRDLVNFVDAFIGIHAAGVIGTEISIHQQVANEAAERFLVQFLNQQNVGEAIQKMRFDLLGKGNLLGLAYTAYCSADLQLKERTIQAR